MLTKQLQGFIKWLNPRGTRDLQLLKSFKQWTREIEGGITKRRGVLGLDKTFEEEEEGYRRRPTRKVAGGDEEGYMGWKVCRFNSQSNVTVPSSRLGLPLLNAFHRDAVVTPST